MVHLNTAADKTLNIVLANTNKALREVLKDISPKDLQLLSKSKDLGSVLASLLKKTPQNEMQNRALIALLKNNPTLKELSSLSTTLKELQQTLQKDDSVLSKNLKTLVSKTLENITTIDDKSLKSKLENSGLFLESKLKNASSQTELQELLSKDMKAVVKKTLEELSNTTHPQKQELVKHLDKLSLQIDYYQLLSHLSNASAIYLPYSFDALEDANVTIKNAKNSKFFCDIELQLKAYGALKLRLGLFEKNQLNINIECENAELEKILQENITALKKNLFDAGLHPKDIRFLKKSDANNYYETTQDLELGFEVKA
jgi:hypothetical protein